MRSSIFHSSDDDDDDDYIKRFSGNSVRRSSIFFGGENEAEKMGRRNATPFWPDMAQLNFAEEPKEQRKKKFKQYFDNITCPGFDKSTNRSLFIFSKDNVIRMFCNFLIHNKLFEYFILFVILANCGVLAADEYLPFEDRTPRSVILAEADPYFLIIFTAEAVLKIIAKGFLLHKGAYLRSPWNILDFIIVVSGLLATISSVFNQPALRALRVLRPVKIVTGFESLHVVLKSIVCAMAPLLQIGFLVLFAVFIFAIIGLEFYCGALHMSCWNPETKEFDYTEDDNQVACSNSIGDNITSIIGAGFICPEGYVCKEGWEGPLSGLQNFDNIYLSFLTVFVVLTMAGWTDLQYRLDDALGRIFNWLYFVPIIIFGAFFMLNLVLGVLSCEFANERQRVEKRKEFLKLRRQKEVDVLVENYLEWILDAEETLLKEDRTSNETKMKIIEARRTSIFKKRRGSFKGQIMSDELQEKTLMERSTNCFSRMWRKQKLTRFKVRRILKSQIFFWLVIALVFINTALIATEHYGQPKWLDDLLTYSEYVFLTIFYLEMLLKMYGLGIRGYFKSMFNSFDFIVLLASTAEIVAQIFDSENSYGFSSLRATRLLRIFKITKYWQSLRNLSLSLINSIKSIMSLLFLLFLFMVIFALLGMQFFGGQFNFEDGRPKANFDTFFSSILTVFQILTGENWDEVLYNGMKALGGFNVKGFFASLYFLLLVVLGSYTLLNVFLAIAVDNLAKADELTSMEMAEEQRRKSLSACDVMEPNNESGYNNDGFEVEIIDMEKEMNEGKITPIIAQKNGGRVKGQNFLSINDQAIIATPRGSIEHEIHKRNSISKMYEEGHMRYKDTDNNNATKYFKKFFKKVKTINDQKKSKRYDDYSRNNNENSPGINRNNNNSNDDKSENPKYIDPNPILPYSSLFIFSSTNPIRKFAHFVVTFPYFDGFIITIILLSCVALAIADPVNYVSEINNVLDKIDLAFTAIFTMEAMLKILNLGLILHKGAYGRDLWNILDLFIVVTAITGIAFEGNGDNLQTIRSLRVLRVLRPLKTINRVAKLKAVFDGLIVAVTRVFVIMTLYILFQLIFAIIAVQLLLGNFFYCTDLSKITKEECRGEYLEFDRDDVTVNAREWKVYEFNFDNIFNSFLTLFVVQTRSGWPEIMKNAMDSSTRNHGPIPESNNAMSIFFIVYFIVFPFFFVNLFVALIVITFQEQGEKDLDELNMDKNQRNCLEFVLNSTPLDCYKPKTTNKIRIKIWKWIISPPFEYLMSTLILLNTITLMLKYYQQPVWYETMLNYFNIFFTVAFTIEFLIKLYGFGFKNYFRQGWNLFDLVTVLGSILDIIVFYAITNTKTLGFLKLFRAMRLLKLLRQSSSIRMLLWTFLQAIFALPYVLLLIWLLFYIYAVIGMQLFGTIQLDPQTAINRHSNFQNFINAIVLLFRCSTLDNWDTVLYACIYGQACDERSLAPNQPPQNTCGSDFSVAYYVSFNFITAFMMLNLFIAVIMDNFDYLTRDSSILGPHHLYDYIQKWATYDPTATGYIHYTKVYDLLRGLEPPVGFGKKCPIKLAYKKLIRMNMPLDDNDQVNFSTTMFALVRESLSIKVVSAEQMDQMDQELRQALASLFFLKPEQINKFVPLKEELAGTKMTVGKIYASLMLVDAWKSYKAAMNPTQQAPKEEKPNILNRFIRRMSHVFNRSNNESKSSSDDDDDDGHPSNKDYQENEAKKEKKIKASRKEVNPNKLGVPMGERRRRSIEEVNTNNNNNNDEDDEYDDSEGQAKILIEEKIKKMKKRKHSEKFKKRSGDRSYNETESKKIRKNEVNHNNNRISAYNDEDVQNRSHKYKSRNRTKCNSNYNKDYNIYDLENAETGDEDKIYNTHNYNNNKNKNYYINRNNNNNGNIHNNTSFTPYNNNIRNNNNNNNNNNTNTNNNNNNNNASTSYAHNNNFKNDNNTNNNNENNYNVNNNGNNNKNSLRNNNSNNKNNNNENDNNKNNNNNNNNNKNNNTDNNSSNNNDDKKTEEKPEEESQSSYNRLTNWVSYYYFDSVNKVRKMIGFEDDTQQMNSEKY